MGAMSQSVVGGAPALAPPDAAVVDGASTKRGSRPLWKWLLALLAAASVVAVGLLLAYRISRPEVSAFRTTPVVRVDITQRVTATGTLQPVITSPVGAQVSGIVWKLHADYNSVVKAGDVLVELDPALFRNAVALAAAQLAEAEAGLSSAQATALGARAARERTANLESQALASKAELDASEANFGQATGLTRSSVAQIAQARAQLARARLDLAHSIVLSPVTGTVISRSVELGQAVASTLTAPTLFTIAQDLGHMQVHAAVDEADIGGVRANQQATFTVDAFREQTFQALVHEVRNAPQTLSNVVTYDVVLDVDNPEGKLRPGMTANVSILIVRRTQVTAVPNEALRFRPATPPPVAGDPTRAAATLPLGSAVYLPEGTTAARTVVKVGVTDGNMTEVEGLALGREVIVDVARNRSKGAASAARGGGHGI